MGGGGRRGVKKNLARSEIAIISHTAVVTPCVIDRRNILRLWFSGTSILPRSLGLLNGLPNPMLAECMFLSTPSSVFRFAGCSPGKICLAA
jgi:hypothetical protein